MCYGDVEHSGRYLTPIFCSFKILLLHIANTIIHRLNDLVTLLRFKYFFFLKPLRIFLKRHPFLQISTHVCFVQRPSVASRCQTQCCVASVFGTEVRSVAFSASSSQLSISLSENNTAVHPCEANKKKKKKR